MGVPSSAWTVACVLCPRYTWRATFDNILRRSHSRANFALNNSRIKLSMTFTPKWDAVSNHVFQHYLSVNEAFDLGLLLHKKKHFVWGRCEQNKNEWTFLEKSSWMCQRVLLKSLETDKGQERTDNTKKKPFFFCNGSWRKCLLEIIF